MQTAMSEQEESLLGHDGEQVSARRRKEEAACWGLGARKARIFTIVSVAAIIIVLSTSLILCLVWHPVLKAPQAEASTGHSSTTTPPAQIIPERDLKSVLRPEEHLSRGPAVRHFSWNITKAVIAPDGAEKEVFFINNQFPGPIIEALSGDTLEIEILNLHDEGVSLHWHGLYMRGANHMDGPVGLTQCAIPPGGKFTYRVPTDGQAGTFWYHAHSELHRGDGLFGGLVIHSPEEELAFQYDEELLFLVGDWYHWPSDRVLAKFMDQTSQGNEPCPDSLLINGLGYFECSMATPGAPVNCSEIQKPWLSLDKRKSFRVRLVNVGSMTGITLAIPDSEMNVIQLDGGFSVLSHPANSVGVLYPAERVDFILSWPEPAADTDTEMIIQLDKEFFLQPNFALTPKQSFLLAAESEDRHPATSNEPEIVNFDLRKTTASALAEPLPEPGEKLMVITVIEMLRHEKYIPKSYINHTSWEPQGLPLLSIDREEWNDHQFVPWTGPEPTWVELTINNLDTNGHPFHLHGTDFYVVGSHEGLGGWDYYNPFDGKPPRGGPFNLNSPLRKDTVYVPPWGYVVIRFLADNEGIWALHCHVLWHQASGMSMAFQVLGDEKNGLSGSPAGLRAKEYCDA